MSLQEDPRKRLSATLRSSDSSIIPKLTRRQGDRADESTRAGRRGYSDKAALCVVFTRALQKTLPPDRENGS